ncbi:MAG: hypothetical protein Hens3KO_03710 [Henriciella sp.]
MIDYAKAALGTLFLGITLGAMCLVVIWGLLSMFHASNIVILSGETIGAIGLLVVAVPLFRLILRNERSGCLEAAYEEVEVVTERPSQTRGFKPTAFV